jgi:ubiquitin-activating enzyme E1
LWTSSFIVRCLLTIFTFSETTAKNLAMMGVKALALQDNNSVQPSHLASQVRHNTEIKCAHGFFFDRLMLCVQFLHDVGKNRAEASVQKLQDINNEVAISWHRESKLSEEMLEQFDVVCVTQMMSEEELVRIDRICRNNSIPMIVGSALGLFGAVFADFGDSWTSADVTGEAPSDAMISNITQDAHGRLRCTCWLRQRFSEGDIVRFDEIVGMTELNGKEFRITFIEDRTSFYIDSPGEISPYMCKGAVTQVKMSAQISHQPLAVFLDPSAKIEDEKLKAFDGSGLDRIQSFGLWKALQRFFSLHPNMPSRWTESDAMEVVDILRKSYGDNLKADRLYFAAQLSRTEFPPMCSIVGGILAQEVIKAASNILIPMDQWLFIDSLDAIPHFDPEHIDVDDSSPFSWNSVLGKEFLDRLVSKKYLLAGSGATGGEMVKLLAQMGFCTGPTGKLSIVDPATIRARSLDNQVSCGQKDIGRLRSEAVADFARSLHLMMNIEIYAHDIDSEHILEDNDELWDSQDAVISALESVPLRLRLDSMSVRRRKALTEMGTHKWKGHVFTTVPHASEVASTISDFEPTVQQSHATLSFPIAGDQCMRWALNQVYLKLFRSDCEFINQFIENPITKLTDDALNAMRIRSHLDSLKELILHRPKSIEDCLVWSRNKFESLFLQDPNRLLFMYPADTRDHNGSLFWGHGKKLPHPLQFDFADPQHAAFVLLGAFLLAKTLRILPHDSIFNEFMCDQDRMLQVAAELVCVPWQPQKFPIYGDQTDEKGQTIPDYELLHIEEDILPLLVEMANETAKTAAATDGPELEDDPVALQFVHVAGQLRASVFDINQWSYLETRRVVCDISPTLVSTAAVTAGFACLELLKSIRRECEASIAPLEIHRNTFFNMALPDRMVQSQLAPAKVLSTTGFTLWDRVEIRDRPDMTIQELMDHIMQLFPVHVDAIGVGSVLIYASFFARSKLRLPRRLVDIIPELSRKPIREPLQRSYEINVSCCSFENEEVEVEIPDVIFYFK